VTTFAPDALAADFGRVQQVLADDDRRRRQRAATTPLSHAVYLLALVG
jgi:hypothetical protein